LTIRDTGSGMAPHVKARMFEPFFTTKPLSTGLGLSSVAATVRHLRGIVSVESRQGIGTSVTIHLPCIVLPNEAGPNRGR
jgi:signal transduction histidine kinase